MISLVQARLKNVLEQELVKERKKSVAKSLKNIELYHV